METLKLKDFLKYTYISNIELNKSEDTLAYVTHVADEEHNTYRSTIHVMHTANNTCKQLTTFEQEKSFKWLNDTNLLFIGNRDADIKALVEKGEPHTCFYRMPIDGGEAKHFFTIKKNVTGFHIVNENTLLLQVFENPSEVDIHTLSNEEKQQAYKTFKENKDYEVLEEIPFWSNGGGFTSGKRTRIYQYNIKEDTLSLLSEDITANETILDVNAQGMLYAKADFVGMRGLTNGLFHYDFAKKKHSVLIEDGTYSINVAKYFGNDILLQMSDMQEAGMNTNGSFYLLNDTGIHFFAAHDLGLGSSVGSDCRYGGSKSLQIVNDACYFVSTEECASFLKRLNKDGTITKITEEAGSVDGIAIGQKAMYYIAMRGNALQEIYIYEGAKEALLTHINTTLEDTYVATPKMIPFQNNGVDFKAFVLEPKDYNPSKFYPAIFDIHGGPKTVYGTCFYHEMQVWASMGYFVFFTNPTGSDGRGNAFADIRGKYGTVDYDDLMVCCDVVEKTYPQIDKKRIGVTGGSYGGFMTNWIIGHTNRFAAAASQRSIANWISKFGTTDIGYFFNSDQQASTPWDNVEKMWWHSPMKYADKCVTPTLFIHSEQDYRCWLVEGLQMFTSLKYHGVDARLCMFRNENHELSRSGMPKHRVRRLEEMTAWFEKYLKA